MAKMNNIGSFTNSSPNWNKTGTEPPASMKLKGFKAGYKPPAGFFNWFWTKVSKCITELQSKITSIVSFLSTDDFIFYKNFETSYNSLSSVNDLAKNNTYRNNDYILQLTIANAAAVAFDLPTAMSAEMRFLKGNAYLFFANGWFFKYNYTTNAWVKVYFPNDPQDLSRLRVRRFDTVTCNDLSDAYSLYTSYKDNYDIVYFETSGLNTQEGARGKIDCLLGQLTFSASSKTWRTDDTNNTFVLN